MQKSADHESMQLWIAQKTIKVDIYLDGIPLSIVVEWYFYQQKVIAVNTFW